MAYRRRRRKGDNDKAMELVLWAVLIVLLMPIFGGWLLFKSTKLWQQVVGGTLLLVGVVLWIMMLL